MSGPFDLEPMPKDALDLVRAEQSRPALPPGDRDRLLSKIRAGLPVTAAALAAARPATPAEDGGSTAVGAGLGGKGAALFVAGLLLGGVGGAVLHARWSPVAVPAPAEIHPAALTPQEAESAPAPTPSAEPTLAASPSPGRSRARAPALDSLSVRAGPVTDPRAAPEPTAPAPAPETPSTDAELARERGVLELARSALARSNPQASLDAAEGHLRQFPRGRLAEERESLRIQALVSLGRVDEARKLLEAFRKGFGQSLLLPLVEAVVASTDAGQTDSSGSGQ